MGGSTFKASRGGWLITASRGGVPFPVGETAEPDWEERPLGKNGHMRDWMRVAVSVASCALIVAMVAVWVLVDLDTADGVASVVGACVGVGGLLSALVQRDGPRGPVLRASGTGTATATGGAWANTGVTGAGVTGAGEATAENTGDADADGAGSNANTGITPT